MRVFVTRRFLKSLSVLPKAVQEKTDRYIPILAVDMWDRRLRTKLLWGDENVYSFRVGRDYRVIFSYDATNIRILDITHRKDAYR